MRDNAVSYDISDKLRLFLSEMVLAEDILVLAKSFSMSIEFYCCNLSVFIYLLYPIYLILYLYFSFIFKQFFISYLSSIDILAFIGASYRTFFFSYYSVLQDARGVTP